MKIASVQFPVFLPYNDPAVEIYVSGCKRKCVGCHNKEIADFNYGELFNVDTLREHLKQRETLFKVIAVSGGDLLCQDPVEAFRLAFMLRHSFDKQLWLFTGEDNLENIPTWAKIMFDVIKYGSYKEELKQAGFPSSSNQKILKR